VKRIFFILGCIFLLSLGGWSTDEPAPVANKLPPMLKDVGIDAKGGAALPLDLAFRDETGKDVHLAEFFGSKPVILTLVYYRCPSLCTMVLNDLTRQMNAMSESCGKDFDVVTISFDPRETPELAREKKRQYLRAYRRPTAEAGWHFLTGNGDSIKRITDAIGFRYTWDPKQQQFIHASGIVIVTKDGKLGRYFYGVEYSAKDIRLALLDADGGKSTSPARAVMFYCFIYDATTGKYSLAVMRLLRVAGVMTLLAIAGFAFVNLRKDRKQASAVT
jgi:protein SCO1/2